MLSFTVNVFVACVHSIDCSPTGGNCADSLRAFRALLAHCSAKKILHCLCAFWVIAPISCKPAIKVMATIPKATRTSTRVKPTLCEMGWAYAIPDDLGASSFFVSILITRLRNNQFIWTQSIGFNLECIT